MKKYFAALSATALISLAPYALATDTLTVKGTITPAACLPSLSGGGMVDNGKIRAKDLNQTSNTQVGTHRLQITVACDAPNLFALNPVDNQPNTASNSTYFGLGLTDADEKIGFVYLDASNAVADGQSVRVIVSDDAGASWDPRNPIQPGSWTSVADAAGPIAPIYIQDLAMDVRISTFIARADSLTLTDDVTLEGSVTIGIEYL
ncbi:DUF1120 domain-containing protein [Pseudomonas sp. PD9R]|uniref:DUF1120 domain-containing protein n=1 Tax=Pseudomonas sp. PD9R TaxID=2853534 RepID=UPI001C45B1E7|nr:DUF1120 domain-containing protein [Pseudomonas sp. PD9R]MBV6827098.1 DUF1120 domain-containing protein [Pseudomonas sp. PD9R]